MELTNYLQELISTEELVCLPEFGGFISKQVSARLDASNHIFTPPHKQIAFNERLTEDGGKFEKHVSLKENISIELASEKIQFYIQNIKKELNENSEFQLEGIGIFYASNDNLTFKQGSDSIVDPTHFGLPQLLVKFQPLDKPTKDLLQKPKDRKAMSMQDMQSVPEFEQEGDNEPVKPHTKPIKKQTSLVWLYIVTPIVILGGLGTFLGGTDDGRKVLANMHLIKSQPSEGDSTAMEETATEADLDQASSEAPAEETTNESFDNAPSAEETIKKTDTETWENTSTETKQEDIAATEDVKLATANLINGKSGRYFIIVGGFSNKGNAVKLREKLIHDGLEAKVISPMEGSDLYRVSLGDYGDRVEAAQKADALKNEYGNDLWVMKY